MLIPGSMGTASYVLVGTDEGFDHSFGTTCHGAGRAMSRTAAKKVQSGAEVRKGLEDRGIVVRALRRRAGRGGARAYKDVDRVVDVVHQAGLARKVARLVPLGRGRKAAFSDDHCQLIDAGVPPETQTQGTRMGVSGGCWCSQGVCSRRYYRNHPTTVITISASDSRLTTIAMAQARAL